CFLIWLIIPLEGETTEIRALWVVKDALYSPATVLQMIEVAQENEFNLILVQVRSRGDAYYRSELVPLAEAIQQSQNPEFDPLQLTVEQGHRAGLQVHVWVNTLILWSSSSPPVDPTHIFHLHPEWFACSDGSRTNSEGIYLSPELPQVKGHLLSVIEEIVENYPIDGLHLDYVRYPNNSYDYNLMARTRFMQRYAIDPLGLAQGSERLADLFGAVGIDNLSEKRLAWRAEQVTDLVGAIHDLISSENPGVALSVAVKPDMHEAYRNYGQDWTEWANRGLVDFVIPMAYSQNTELVVQQVEQAVKTVGHERLYAGIGTYNKPISETLRQIQTIETLGVKGICLFSYNSLQKQPGSFEELRGGFLPQHRKGKDDEK
ncbi:MAG: family 10 glycosylhydrolase, partial [Candidatus Latescibacteria bacterium]|nr:family 10 glycosylhydrolase [Candidatus Latescibacterota bacterium]